MKSKFPSQIDLDSLDLRHIKDQAMDNYKNHMPDPRLDNDYFVTQCYTLAVVAELYKKGYTEFVAKRNYYTEDK